MLSLRRLGVSCPNALLAALVVLANVDVPAVDAATPVQAVSAGPDPMAHVQTTYGERYPFLFRYWNRVVDRRATTRLPAFRAYTTYFPAPSGLEAGICFIPKVGSTRWMQLLYKSKANDASPRYANLERAIHRTRAPWITDENKHTMHSPETLGPGIWRFVFLREPYARLLSGFLDKAVYRIPPYLKPQILDLGGPFEATPAEFHRFLKSLIVRFERGEKTDAHFNLQSWQCGMDKGGEYDFYLKLEDESIWYADLVTLLGLTNATSSGWDEGKPNADPCFLKLPGMDCAATTAALHHHSTVVRPNEHNTHHTHHTSAGAHYNPTGAATGAATKMREYYASQEVIDLATRYCKEDLLKFGYPEMRLSD